MHSIGQVCFQSRYKAAKGEQIGYRYLVESSLDQGSFGVVLKCVDMKEGASYVALKLSSNKPAEVVNSQVEAKLLEKVKDSKG